MDPLTEQQPGQGHWQGARRKQCSASAAKCAAALSCQQRGASQRQAAQNSPISHGRRVTTIAPGLGAIVASMISAEIARPDPVRSGTARTDAQMLHAVASSSEKQSSAIRGRNRTPRSRRRPGYRDRQPSD